MCAKCKEGDKMGAGGQAFDFSSKLVLGFLLRSIAFFCLGGKCFFLVTFYFSNRVVFLA